MNRTDNDTAAATLDIEWATARLADCGLTTDDAFTDIYDEMVEAVEGACPGWDMDRVWRAADALTHALVS